MMLVGPEREMVDREVRRWMWYAYGAEPSDDWFWPVPVWVVKESAIDAAVDLIGAELAARGIDVDEDGPHVILSYAMDNGAINGVGAMVHRWSQTWAQHQAVDGLLGRWLATNGMCAVGVKIDRPRVVDMICSGAFAWFNDMPPLEDTPGLLEAFQSGNEFKAREIMQAARQQGAAPVRPFTMDDLLQLALGALNRYGRQMIDAAAREFRDRQAISEEF